MPRLPRIHLDSAIYYVTSRGLRDQEIFKEKADYQMYTELLSKYKSQHKFLLYSYSLLPDRLNLLIETGDDATISEIMHDLNSLYTKHYNTRYQKRGHLFESRFKSVLVEKQNYLLKMTRYIHQLSGDSYKDYPYSSYHFYTERPEGAPAMDLSEEVKKVKEFLTDRDNTDAYEKYCLFGDKKEVDELAKSLKRGSVLGSEVFVAEVRNRIKSYTETQKEEAQAEIKQASRPYKVVVAMIGALVLVATASSVYLYISKSALENQYAELLLQKEAEFNEKTRFENRNPLALTELEGTEWAIEMVSLPADKAKEKIQDKLVFKNGHVMSEYFSSKGFSATNYSVTPKENGLVVWETIQSAANGDSISWRGDWQGDAMKGVISFQPAGKPAQDFSFFSTQWSYGRETK